MPTLLTPKRNDSTSPQEPTCNFSVPAQNVMVEQDVTLEELRARCARYEELLASLNPPQDKTMLRAANFTRESVQRLLEQSPDSPFLRVYYGIKEDGEHLLFMAPVAEAGSDGAIIYADDCCSCPPKEGCPDDEILSW